MLTTAEIVQGLHETTQKNYALLTQLKDGDPKIPLLRVTGSYFPKDFGKGLLEKLTSDSVIEKKIWNRFEKEVQILDSNAMEEKVFKSILRGVPYIYAWYHGKWFVRDETKKWKELSKAV